MPTYVFVDSNDQRHERTMSVASLETITVSYGRYDVPGLGECWIDVEAQQVGLHATPGNWPMACDAAGVHPDQVRDHQKLLAKQGIHTDFTSDGRPVFRDASHRKRHCEAYGFYDRNAGYNDPQPRKH